MVQRAMVAVVGVVLGLFLTFSVFGTILGAFDNFYLVTQDTCNYGTADSPKRVLRLAIDPLAEQSGDPDKANWAGAATLRPDASEQYCTGLAIPGAGTHRYLTPTGGVITVKATDMLSPGATALTPGAPSNNKIVSVTPPLTWVKAENAFTAQRQLVALLAVIAALGMPIGAMTAIVFFGQAVVSTGASGEGAGQVLVAMTAVALILVAVQMFELFSGYLGDAFTAVDGDRFVVFNETLGTVAVTISEFWGVLAFAGLINVATIVWRNYGSNYNVGRMGGGL